MAVFGVNRKQKKKNTRHTMMKVKIQNLSPSRSPRRYKGAITAKYTIDKIATNGATKRINFLYRRAITCGFSQILFFLFILLSIRKKGRIVNKKIPRG